MSNRGKGFEKCFKEQLSEYPDVLVYRIPDQMSMVKGSCNPADFIVYKRPSFLYCELKTTSTCSLPSKNISDFQLQSMREAINIRGVKAFVVVWFYQHSCCKAYKIKYLYNLFVNKGKKSVSHKDPNGINIPVIKELKKYCVWDWSVLLKAR